MQCRTNAVEGGSINCSSVGNAGSKAQWGGAMESQMPTSTMSLGAGGHEMQSQGGVLGGRGTSSSPTSAGGAWGSPLTSWNVTVQQLHGGVPPEGAKGCTSRGPLIRTIPPAGSTDCSAQWAAHHRELGCQIMLAMLRWGKIRTNLAIVASWHATPLYQQLS